MDAVQILDRYPQPVLTDAGSIQVLARLLRDGPTSFAGLAKATESTPPALNKHLNSLYRSALVEKYNGELWAISQLGEGILNGLEIFDIAAADIVRTVAARDADRDFIGSWLAHPDDTRNSRTTLGLLRTLQRARDSGSADPALVRNLTAVLYAILIAADPAVQQIGGGDDDRAIAALLQSKASRPVTGEPEVWPSQDLKTAWRAGLQMYFASSRMLTVGARHLDASSNDDAVAFTWLRALTAVLQRTADTGLSYICRRWTRDEGHVFWRSIFAHDRLRTLTRKVFEEWTGEAHTDSERLVGLLAERLLDAVETGHRDDPAAVRQARIADPASAKAASAANAEHERSQPLLSNVQAALDSARREILQLRRRLESEHASRPQAQPITAVPMIAESSNIQRVMSELETVAPTATPILLLGEEGTGKEMMVRAIHELSKRRERPLVRVNCSAIPAALLESELFGRERGAYTGATTSQIGRFEAANHSTLFLDEIDALPPALQVKILRALEERVVERLGASHAIPVDVRLIAATSRNLAQAVREGTFREDLYYRLNVVSIAVPPLRERPDDIPALAWTFVEEFSKQFGKTITSIASESMSELQRYRWPGNVRELRNVIERAVILATGPELVVHAPAQGPQMQGENATITLSEIERDHIRSVLETTKWRVRGTGGAAERLGLRPSTLESRMRRLGISRRDPKVS